MTTVVKVGGSLAAHRQKLRTLCNKLSEISKKQKLVIVPGGGEFADVVRRLDKRFALSCAASHRMAILGMDQYGLFLSDLMPHSYPMRSFEEVKKALDAGKLPVFLPSQLMLSEDPLENSWDVTSDSIGAYVAGRLGVGKLLLVTDVDGVFTADPKSDSAARLIKKLSANDLLGMKKRTSVDVFLPSLLLKLSIDCFVVNGMFPDRVEAVLNGQETTFTLIKSKFDNNL